MSVLQRVVVVSLLTVSVSALAQPIAGLKPDQRPEAAPVARTEAVDPAIKNVRLTGISTPLPGNVERIAEQGNWYSPMFKPGMPGPYDLRGWHGRRQR